MRELIEQFLALDPSVRASILLGIAGGVVYLLRLAGMNCAPGLTSVLASIFSGTLLGFVSSGWTWQGALLGLVAGLAAVGFNQVPRQADKLTEDQEKIIEMGTYTCP